VPAYLDGFISGLGAAGLDKRADVKELLLRYLASKVPTTTSPIEADPSWRAFQPSAPTAPVYNRIDEWRPGRVLGPGSRRIEAGALPQGFHRNVIG
jgi:hypothetical protein